MTEAGERGRHSRRRWLLRALLVFGALSVLLVIALRLYLGSSAPARQLSRYLTAYLHQEVRVARVELSGGTLYLKEVTLANPVGFAPGRLLSVGRLALAPDLGSYLSGGRRLRLLELDGVEANLSKNRGGEWNFAPLQRLLASRKPSPRETVIGALVIRRGTLSLEGYRVPDISLKVLELASRGSLDSRLELSFRDGAGNLYRVVGRARPGKDAAIDAVLSSNDLALSAWARGLKLKDPALLARARGDLALSGSLHRGDIALSGTLRFRELQPQLAARRLPIGGNLTFAARYLPKDDELRLDRAALELKELATVRARGVVHQVKKGRNYDLQLALEPMDVARLGFLLPEAQRRRMALAGRLRLDELRLQGSARGLATLTGATRLEGGSLTRDGRPLFSGLFAEALLSGSAAGYRAVGRLRLGAAQGGLVREAAAPFVVDLAPRFRLLTASFPTLAATIGEIPLRGGASFTPRAPVPLRARLQLADTEASRLNRWLGNSRVRLDAGTVSAQIDAAGRGWKDLTVTVAVGMKRVGGSRGGKRFALLDGKAGGRIAANRGRYSAYGRLELGGLAYQGRQGTASFDFNYADHKLLLRDLFARLDGSAFAVSRLDARFSPRVQTAGATSLPLAVECSGWELSHGELAVKGGRGELQGNYRTDPRGGWLEGGGTLALGELSWRGQAVGAPWARFTLARTATRATIGGPLLGGELSAAVAANPMKPRETTSFQVAVRNVSLAQAGALLPKRQGAVSLSDGRLQAEATGRYGTGSGVEGSLSAKGEGLSLTGSGNRKLVAGAEVTLSAALAGRQLTLNKGLVRSGETVLNLTGQLADPFSPQRKGRFAFVLPQTGAAALVDLFANTLPPFLQQATVSGGVAADGSVVLGEGVPRLEAVVAFRELRVESSAQKVSVAGVNGRLPLSLELGGEKGARRETRLPFARENYAELRQRLSRRVARGEQASVGKIALGALELTGLKFRVAAREGRTDIVSLTGTLLDGTLLGAGSISLAQGLSYRGDLLVNDASLKRLCETLPNLKGYISGRVDGVLSIQGEGKGGEGLVGYTNLWAKKSRGEKMVVSKEFLQRLSKRKISGLFFSMDRPYDQAEINAYLEKGYLTFEKMSIMHTNFLGVRDLSVNIAPSQNRIALDHLLDAIKRAAARSKGGGGEKAPEEAPAAPAPAPEFRWEE